MVLVSVEMQQMYNLQVHMALGEYEEAKDCLERTHKIRSRVYGTCTEILNPFFS